MHDSIFCAMGKLDLGILAENKTMLHFKKGQVIFHQNTHPQGLYCVHSGKVVIHSYNDNGRNQILRLAKCGSILGYRALFTNERYHVSATAIEDSTVCYFPQSAYQEHIISNHSVAIEIIKLLSADLKTAELKAMSMVHKQVRERIAETLIVLRDFFGTEENNVTLNTILSRENIADIAGATTETTIRVLSDFQKAGIIELAGKSIGILNVKELLRIANLPE
ncbi:MAG: Anaerobic regulatory protein [Chlorobi bacterium]|nr:MAG: Crp/Fnr family transcriptional regulator [Chlorobi bacterium OLB6]MBV6462760.1 Anaerobic regulatory protein [Chlorobiota bacterium]MBW7854149.1 Crp/Fnr family transcriptional regulator [Candidatus Kapabacteria bacterium]QOJ25842.1 MAG: Crp/Fnr family transcriptional regulator [Ignavibacteria bacterium]MBZ0195069.1 Crp/Fnr family transcriptional regulator [Candidatus Kapabacteria bacterium]